MNTISPSNQNRILNAAKPAYYCGVLLNYVRVRDDTAEGLVPLPSSRVELPDNRADFLEFVRNWELKNKSVAKLGAAVLLILPLAVCGCGLFGTGIGV